MKTITIWKVQTGKIIIYYGTREQIPVDANYKQVSKVIVTYDSLKQLLADLLNQTKQFTEIEL